jgi:hypothetical protein
MDNLTDIEGINLKKYNSLLNDYRFKNMLLEEVMYTKRLLEEETDRITIIE